VLVHQVSIAKSRRKAMAHLLVIHTVEDFDRWKVTFDDHGKIRRANGGGDYQVLRNAHNPNEVVVLFEWDSVENAQTFASSDNLREAMQKAGVVSKPNIYFLD
jgi:heme-degrading monooxygenase HmoA